MKIHSSKSSKLVKTQPSSLSKARLIIQKRLNQVRTTFKPAQILTVAGAALILYGTGLSFSGNVEEAKIMTEAGGNLCLVSEYLFKQKKEANEQLDKKEKDEE